MTPRGTGTPELSIQVLRELARSNQHRVLLVRPSAGANPWVLKQLVHRDEEGAAAMEREIDALRTCQSPHILEIHEVLALPEGPGIAMEYAEQGTLRTMLQEGRFDELDVLRWCQEILGALAAIHEHGLIHRDLKPDNIFLTKQREAKVGDLSSVLRPGESTLSATGRLVGTPMYMAPEYVADGVLDSRSDLYALGVILYELFAHTAPFHGSSVQDLLKARLGAVPDLAEERYDLPLSLTKFVGRLMAVDPTDRYQDARSALDALPGMFARVASMA